MTCLGIKSHAFFFFLSHPHKSAQLQKREADYISQASAGESQCMNSTGLHPGFSLLQNAEGRNVISEGEHFQSVCISAGSSQQLWVRSHHRSAEPWPALDASKGMQNPCNEQLVQMGIKHPFSIPVPPPWDPRLASLSGAGITQSSAPCQAQAVGGQWGSSSFPARHLLAAFASSKWVGMQSLHAHWGDYFLILVN